MKLGINLKIDVTKIDKERLFQGKKGTYLDATIFLNVDQEDQYGNHGFIAQAVTKEEKEAGAQGNILGNGKIFWCDYTQAQNKPASQPTEAPVEDFDSIPF